MGYKHKTKSGKYIKFKSKQSYLRWQKGMFAGLNTSRTSPKRFKVAKNRPKIRFTDTTKNKDYYRTVQIKSQSDRGRKQDLSHHSKIRRHSDLYGTEYKGDSYTEKRQATQFIHHKQRQEAKKLEQKVSLASEKREKEARITEIRTRMKPFEKTTKAKQTEKDRQFKAMMQLGKPTEKDKFKLNLKRSTDLIDFNERRGGMIPIGMAAKEMKKSDPSLTKKKLYKHLFDLERERVIDLQVASDPKLIRPERKKWAYKHPSRGWINYVLIRPKDWDEAA